MSQIKEALDLYYSQRYHTVDDSDNDGLKMLKSLLLSEAKEYSMVYEKESRLYGFIPVQAIPIEAINKLFGGEE